MSWERMKIFVVIALVGTFLFVGNVWAMSSTNFRLDWVTPLTGAGGGRVSSPNFVANFTIGQTVIGTSSSTNFSVGLGFWNGIDANLGSALYLPLILK